MKLEIIADDKSYKIIVEWKNAEPDKWVTIRDMVEIIEKMILKHQLTENKDDNKK